MFHKLKSVTPLPDYTLLANFSDGSVKSYDFRPLLDRMEVYAPLRESPAFWASAAVDPGGYGVSWSDEIDISAEELWGARRRRRKPVLRSSLVRRRHRPMGSQRKRPAQSRGIP